MTSNLIESVEAGGPPPHWLWRLPFSIGMVQVLFGIAVLVWPGVTLNVVAILIGLNLAIGGVLRLAMAAVDANHEGRGVMVIWALLSVLAGIVIMRAPEQSLALIVIVLGSFWVVWGLIEAFVAMTPGARGSRGALFFEAALAIVAGMVLLAWPTPSLTVIVWIAGLGFIVVGSLAMAVGWTLRAAINDYEALAT
ncbi:MAG TPA: DUF308 domain-containing protein [Nitriliruptoraceae bacterium]|nr:DUF308 domain-containing protein [Nitriliruptoraceae bacterium]